MTAIVHRGTREVGGNCVELACDGQRVLLDIGAPLEVPEAVAGSSQEPKSKTQRSTRRRTDTAEFLPKTLDLTAKSGPLLGVVVSHTHADHYGLWSHVDPATPCFLGDEALAVLRASQPFTGVHVPKKMVPYQSYKWFSVGPFRIKPFLVDHSAYHAHALLVECGGKRLLYTGDLRDNGRKTGALRRLLNGCPRPLDALVIEGTNVGRADDGKRPKTEARLQAELAKRMKATKGIVLAYYSAQNIDRFVTFLKAARDAGRTMVIDVYSAELLRAIRETGRKTFPDPTDSDLRVFLPYWMKRRLVSNGKHNLPGRYRFRRIYHSPENELRERAGKLVMMFRYGRRGMQGELKRAGVLDNALLVYSMWHGYLERNLKSLKPWCEKEGIGFEIHHVSGHAPFSVLKRVVRALHPTRLFPIHTEHPEAYEAAFPQTVLLRDGVPSRL